MVFLLTEVNTARKLTSAYFTQAETNKARTGNTDISELEANCKNKEKENHLTQCLVEISK